MPFLGKPLGKQKNKREIMLTVRKKLEQIIISMVHFMRRMN